MHRISPLGGVDSRKKRLDEPTIRVGIFCFWSGLRSTGSSLSILIRTPMRSQSLLLKALEWVNGEEARRRIGETSIA